MMIVLVRAMVMGYCHASRASFLSPGELASSCKTLASSRVQIFQSLGPKLALTMFVLALGAVGVSPKRLLDRAGALDWIEASR